ncbi:MAG TPA: hypothetical protein VF749_13725 [Candidatus Acidoferrum sp.]
MNSPSASENTAATEAVVPAHLETFAPLSARRLLALGGIALILVGMLVGDIFAVFVLHQNAAKVGEALSAAAHAVIAGDANAVALSFQSVGSFLENRGTKVDTHVHMIALGYLALLLGILEPWVALRDSTRRKVAWLFLFGAWLLPVGVFLIHYVGLAYSPLEAIGWASIFADFGGALVIVATVAWLFGIARQVRQVPRTPFEDVLLNDRSRPGRILLRGGLALVLLGFLHGAYYAAFDLYRHEVLDYSLLSELSTAARAQNTTAVDKALGGYGRLAGEKAVNIATHAHAIEFGLLAMLLAFFQPYVSLGDSWKRNWAWVLLCGSLALPVSVLLELKLGLLAGGIADVGGLLVILALLAMWIGIVRHTGEIDARARAAEGRRG